ncbi:aminoglycoside phosphotransferase family protein [Nocardia yamanashiensis]|nr:aminoglycoside phosphotransferase family protein [Nocardia yamanashiensis]UGT38931.1 aminoglycoside phosphotransferase family protein [Nocardia yamanashiensis]
MWSTSSCNAGAGQGRHLPLRTRRRAFRHAARASHRPHSRIPSRILDAALATLRDLGPDQPATLVHGDLHDANVLASDREPWLAVDPKGQVGDPAQDALNVIRSPRFASVLLDAPNLRPAVLRLLEIYCEAAGIEFDRARRWMQAGAVREALWGRAHGDPVWLVDCTEQLAAALTS